MTQTDASNRAEDLQTSIAVHARLSAFGSRRVHRRPIACS